MTMCRVGKTVLFGFLVFAVILGPMSCSSRKPFQRETAQKRDELKLCFDKGDELGEAYHIANPVPAGTGIFTEGNLHAGAARDVFTASSCAQMPGAKCERACYYGVKFPHSYRGAGITLDDLWTEDDLKLTDAQTPPAESLPPGKLAKLAKGESPIVILDRNGWSVSESIDWNGTIELILDRHSEREASDNGGLNIECTNGRVASVFLRTDHQVASSDGDPVAVQLKFDNSGVETRRWKARGPVVFSDSPTSLIKRLSEAQTLVAQFTTFQQQKQTLRFKTSGLIQSLDFISDVCRVK